MTNNVVDLPVVRIERYGEDDKTGDEMAKALADEIEDCLSLSRAGGVSFVQLARPLSLPEADLLVCLLRESLAR